MPPEPEFETLLEPHYGALYRFALSPTRQESDAADLTQQAFLIWAQKGHQLRDRSKARTWLFTTLIISASFTAWQEAHFDLPDEAALAAADFDADADGLPNLVEYALRLNPRSSDARRLMNELAFNGAEQLEFSELVRDDDPKLRVVWEVAGTLPFTEPTTVEPATSDPTPADGLRTLTFTDPLARGVVSARYGRLRFELLP